MNLTWLEWIVLMPNSLVIRRWFFLHSKRQISCRSRTPSASYNKICAMNLTNMNAIRLTTDEYSIHATSICGSRWQLDVNSYAMQSLFEWSVSSIMIHRQSNDFISFVDALDLCGIDHIDSPVRIRIENGECKQTHRTMRWPRWFLSNQCQHTKG